MWLYVYFPHLLLEGAYQHLLRSSCLAVVDPTNHELLDINEQAQQAGLEVGMNLQTAICLAPNVIPVNTDELLLEDIIATLVKKVRNISSWISQDEQSGLYIEIASMQKLLGTADEITEKVRALLNPLSCFISSAPNAKAARFFARSHISVHVQQDNLRTYLNSLHIQNLDFTLEQKLNLSRLGIVRLSDLLRLRPADIAYRLSLDLAHELEFITGQKRWLPKPSPQQKIFSKKLPLDFEIEESQRLFFPISKLLRLLVQDLVANSLQSTKVAIRCLHRENLPSNLWLTLARPSQNAEEWFYILRHELNRYTPPASIIEIHILCKWFHPMEHNANELIQGESQYQFQRLNSLINKLDSRIGHAAYYFLHSLPGPQPEAHTIKTSFPSHSKHKGVHFAHSRKPTFLMNRPKLIKRNHYRLLHGPERFDGGWWQSEACKRDYFIAQHKTGARHWLFRDDKNQWFMHGIFS